MDRDEKAAWGIMGALLLLLITFLLAPRVPQPASYHNFAADHEILGVPRFWNVVSNAPFLVVAVFGFVRIRRHGANPTMPAVEWTFVIGVFLTGFGSAYYHWEPTTPRLFWDRLPMTIAFSAVTAALVGQRISPLWGRKLLWPLLALSVLSVVYWRWTESFGKGNLVPYGFVQFGTTLLVLIVLLLFPRRGREQNFLWAALVMYGAAKLMEHYDRPIAESLQVMGGHPIKHLAAALGCHCLALSLFPRKPAAQSH